MIVTLNEFLDKNIKDEVFIIETDTVYGIGCLYNSSVGAKRIMEIKNRSEEKHFSILVSNIEQVKDLTIGYENAVPLINKYWPGALTIIFNKSDKVKDFVSKTSTVGLRMPDSEATLKVLSKFGPMIMTSLNKSGERAITKFNDTLKYLESVDYIIKGQDLNGVPSTVYDAINDKVLRTGSIIIK